jgi:CRISPR-associated protein Cmr2
LGVDKLETYYTQLMMDGDRMGAILAGDEATHTAISYLQSFHPKVQSGFAKQAGRNAKLKAYGDQPRAISPNRHLAISGALNDFSQTVVRHVVEQEHLGRVLYAGGDDVLAMLPTADLLSAMQRLRHAYSGSAPHNAKTNWGMLRNHHGDVRHQLVLNKGFAWLNGRLMRMMSPQATASTGAVIAHHQAPLGAVLQALRAAEKRAKNEGGHRGGRDAFSITVVKRSGGTLSLTEHWGEPMDLLHALIAFLRAEGTSRRAVFNSLDWMRDLPEPTSADTTTMLATLLSYQFDRQSQAGSQTNKDAPALAQRLATLCAAQTKQPLNWLANFMGVAEFLARETRTGATPFQQPTATGAPS